jgi:Flp pilus assembly protein TadB
VTANPTILILIAAAFVATGAWLMLRRRQPTRRQRMVRDLLDAADALESRLRIARAEIEAVAGEDGADPVGDAMREMLRQRLWLRDHSRTASLDQLAEVRESIDVARRRIEQQLSRIERARAPMA